MTNWINTEVSHGTHRTQDLIPAFMEVLEQIDNVRFGAILAAGDGVPEFAVNNPQHDFWDSEEAQLLLDELFELLNEYAPEGCFFGAHEGDGSSFGFWQLDQEQ